ncbi:MAG: 16S rRNA (guanine(966)-N(2))-methyltransferase RsmD [Firmicutes bacterium]|nr:16S rRNA (guanine(966)-N(2))-methyltransferase RsmD [Bacillota bacterium]MBR3706534.1 16S rRNA (guanine(966)-N(2))-methyltransferase RsmD [Bacillota bacterium]
MRIITGDFKGRRLEMPEGKDIRPTTEKVKEAIFSIIAGNVPGAVCVDLFAGTGNLGLEALSRGAEKCYFADNSRESLNLIKRNIAMCKAEEWSVVIPGDFERVLTRLGERGEKIDIFFLDPPYREGLYEKCFELIREYDLLAEEGIIIAEHGEREPLPEEIEGYIVLKERNYGSVAITIYG